jgi:hypothetical protein
MVKRAVSVAALAGLLILGGAGTASAQVVHGFNFGAGFWWPAGLDRRVAGDVLVANLNQPVIPGLPDAATGSLAFDFGDFRAFPIFGEYQLGVSDHLEFGFGVSYTNVDVPSVYRDLLNGHNTIDPSDDTEIPQTLSLRQIPITAVARILFGRPETAQAYVGGGFAAVNFHYREAGQFVQLSDLSVYSQEYVAKGMAFGGLLLGGLRFGLGGDVYALTVEGRYQWASGDTGGAPKGFLGDKIDLSGGSITFGLLIRY